MKTLKYCLLFIILFIFIGISSCNTDMEDLIPDDSELAQKDDDDDDVKHPTQFFIRLDPGISESELNDLTEDLNAEELWYIEELNLRLWNTTVFPYTDAQGQQITNIDGQVARARTKASVNSIDFNADAILINPVASQSLFCFEDTVILAPAGNNNVKISIFDTGIDESSTLGSNFTGYDYIEDDDTPNDEHGHGTQIATLIHGLVNQSAQAQDISFDIRKTHNAQGLGYLSALIPAIVDAVNDGADILNFSFSYQDLNVDTAERPLRLAVDYAEQNGVLIVASSGNTNKNNDTDAIIAFPASYPNANIISTASLGCDNQLSGFSSYGATSVDIGFLGENIPATGLNGNTAEKSGTSFTSAIITSMAAILASHQNETSASAIKCALISTSTYSEDLKDRVASQGVVDFPSALNNVGTCN